MSNSNLVSVRVPAHNSNFTYDRNGCNIEIIAIHHMAGILSAEQCGEIFQTMNRGASSHYGVGKDGEIGQYVDEQNIAWCNSNWDSNCRSVTIETSNCEIGGQWAVSDVTLNSLIKLVADIVKRNNLGTLIKGVNVVWHSMYANTSCPGPYLLSKMDYIIEQANLINNTVLEPAPQPQPSTKSIDELAQEVIQGVWGNGDDRLNKLTQAGYDYNSVQARVNELLSSNSDTGSIVYTVQPGDTLSGIAAKYGMNWQDLYNSNRFVVGDNPDLIYSGQVLVIK